MEKYLPYFQSDFVHDFIDVCQRLEDKKKKSERSGMVNVLQRNMSAVIPNTSSHRALEEEESSGFVLHVEELRHNNSAASLSHHKEQKNTAQGFPHP